MNYKVEGVLPYDKVRAKNGQVAEMFNEIAPQYDKLNSVLSLGIARYWRWDAIKVLKKYRHDNIIDIATGTGDFAILASKILKSRKITGVDISKEMMRLGQEKVARRGLSDTIIFEQQDSASMNYNDDSFDAATVSFGVRNFEDIDRSFTEILRVLKPGGLFLFLELTTPEITPMKQIYNSYTKLVMPLIARIMKTEEKAYQYLPDSIAAFPQGREMMLILKKNGFTNIRLRRYTLGTATLYLAEKPQ